MESRETKVKRLTPRTTLTILNTSHCMHRIFLVTAALGIILLVRASDVDAAVVIHTGVDGSSGSIVLTLGTKATIDFFISTDDGTTVSVDSGILFLEVHDADGLATNAPTIGTIDLTSTSSTPPFLFAGGVLGGNDSGSGTTQRDIDFEDGSGNTSVDISPTVKKLASVTFDASNLAISTGTYKLRFDIGGGLPGGDVTQFISGADTTNPISPMLNTGTGLVSVSSGLTIEVKAVPEPSAFMLVAIVGMIGYSWHRFRPGK